VGRFTATGTKSFQTDYPLDPENAVLNHFCTEGPEPYNAYSGNVVTDAQGYAVVQLPEYFESINRDYRYQLTVIDGSDDFVLAKVARKIENNRWAAPARVSTSPPLPLLARTPSPSRRAPSRVHRQTPPDTARPHLEPHAR